MTSSEESYDKHYITLAQMYRTFKTDGSTKATEKVINIILQQDGLNYQIPANRFIKTVKPHLIGSTALHLAVNKRQLAIFKILVDNGADFTIKNANNETPLHQAMGFSTNTESKCYSLKGKLDHPYADTVLSAHLHHNIFSNPCNDFGLSHLHIACMANNAKAVDHFLKNGVSVSEGINTDSPVLPGFTPLHFAARYCSLEAAEILLKYGANINTRDAVGQTPIHILLQRNIQIIDYTNMSRCLLHNVFQTEFETNKSMIQLLLSNSKIISFSDVDDIGLSGLHVICTLQDVSMFQADIDCETINHAVKSNSPLCPGYTALHFAAHFSLDAVKLLINRGADITAKDSKGITPMDLCLQRYEAEDIHSIIISRTTWKTIQFSNSKTKLADFFLAMKSDKDLKNLLEKSMANLNVSIPSNSELFPGWTPLHFAILLKDRFKDTNDLYKNTDYVKMSCTEKCLNCMERNDDSYAYTDNVEMSCTEKCLNCMEENEDLYVNRIKLCLDFGADVTIKDASGSTPLHHAFYTQKEEIVSTLFEMHDKSLNPSNENGLCHMHIACAMDDKRSVEKFLRAGCEINSRVNSRYDVKVTLSDDEDVGEEYAYTITPGSTALHIAVSIGNQDLCRTLINNGADVYAQESSYGFTPIHLSIVSDHHLVLNDISNSINLLPLVRNLKECTSNIGLTHLHVACDMGDVKAVEKLIRCGTKIDATIAHSDLDESSPWYHFQKTYAGKQATTFAWNASSLDIVALLVSHGADLLYKIPERSLTPFYETLFVNNKFDVTDNLYPMLKRDKNLQSRITSDTGMTMLHFACDKLEFDDIQDLLRCGANPNAQAHVDSPFWPGYTPLHVLLKEGPNYFETCNDILDLLLEHGADITLTNAEQNTPLHEAFMGSFLEYLSDEDFPIQAHENFSVNPVNAHGISHFHLACYSRDVTAIKLFLKKGVDFKQPIDYFSKEYGGWTPLHFAAYTQCKEAVCILLRAGADANSQDTGGNNPLHEALTGYRVSEPISEDVLKMLIKAGSNLTARNLYGGTVLEMLLEVDPYLLPKGALELFFERGSVVNIFNEITNHGYICIMASQQRDGLQSIQQHPFYKEVIDNPEKNKVDHMGRTPIHNIVSCSYQILVRDDEYQVLIEGFVNVGCDIDHQDKKGRTALHTAIHFKNRHGIVALLMNGIDVNVLDHKGKAAFTSFNLQKPHPSEQTTHSEILRSIATHLYKLELFGIYVNKANETLRNMINISDRMKNRIKKDCGKEMEKLKVRKIESHPIYLADMLSETGLVARYPNLSEPQCEDLDTIFRLHSQQLFNEYPNLVGLLFLQYRKALSRKALIEPAHVALNSLVGLPVPHVCMDIIFRFLANDDFKSLISSVE